MPGSLSPIEKDATNRSKILRVLSSGESSLGRPTGSEIIQIFPLTPSLLRVYGIVLFQKGPVYARWDCFKTAPGGWIITELVMDMTAERVLPAGMLYKK